MKLLIKNDKIIGTATDEYTAPMEWILAPDWYVDGKEYQIVNGQIIEPTDDDNYAEYLANCESAVDAHMLAQVTSLGYDTIDSISKYFRSTSPFYAECVAIGDWIDACWLKCHELLALGEMLTAEELIAEMPIYGV